MAQLDLCVQRVTVEYVIKGQAFTVEFDPMKVGSIFFRKADKDAAVEKQAANTGKAPTQHVIPASAKIPAEFQNHQTEAKTVKVVAAPELSGPSLWWHTNTCIWFHPQD